MSALIERMQRAKSGVTVGVHADAPAADYAVRSEFNGRLGVREFADSGAATNALRDAAAEVFEGKDLDLSPAAEKLADAMRVHAAHKSGRLQESIQGKVK